MPGAERLQKGGWRTDTVRDAWRLAISWNFSRSCPELLQGYLVIQPGSWALIGACAMRRIDQFSIIVAIRLTRCWFSSIAVRGRAADC